MSAVEQLLGTSRVIPVIVIEDLDDAVPIASALVAGGLHMLEITLRTDCAQDAIRRIAGEVDGAVVGAGTVINAAQVESAVAAGAQFLVSPGCTPSLLAAMAASGVPHLPGSATASDVVALLERGISFAKLFPAAAVGGTTMLQALAGPFPEMRFCPTGGIGVSSAPDYLALSNVICVGGSWMLPKDAIAAQDWVRIEALARAASALGAAPAETLG